ncbi:MAG: 2-C-methyl-D-erythritol 2,4-cyclodiphosphate synthase [Clostridia bacterium]|nr:2-C-methyl-D-erythritol 2,4-cyclodiphosphate synthase [Clostridia bacterium]
MAATNKISVIVCAAGKGERAGFDKNKLLAPLYGAPAIWHTLKKFDIKEIAEVIVAASEVDFEEISALCKPFNYKVIKGGKTRTESVKNALAAVTGDIVLIHDGARPFLSKSLILDCIDGVKKFGSAVCAVKLTDTAVCGQLGLITDRLDRETTFRVQTPQGFLTEDIRRAYKLAGNKIYTDDSAVYGEFIAQPRLIDGEESNLKLTFKSDFMRELPRFGGACGLTGFGVDVHAFGKKQKFVKLCGVEIPCDEGLIAHSDGDVALHAVMDAVLSAAGLKDIGHYFPDNDPTFKDADSALLLEKVIEIIGKQGLTVGNLSVAIQAEKPRLAPFIEKSVERLSALTGAKKKNISITAGTCEGLGFVGERLGICVYAVATLKEVN